jgi:hypothetical protein
VLADDLEVIVARHVDRVDHRPVNHFAHLAAEAVTALEDCDAD